jgi:hypothetical protein
VHALPVDSVSFGAGVSSQLASSAIKSRINRGESAAGQPLSNGDVARTYADGVLLDALIAPETSPWVAARVGLPANSEAGLTYTGRAIRLDGRHVLSLGGAWGLSAGLGASALFLSGDAASDPTRPPASPTNPQAEFEVEATGWGADLPILVGYQGLGGLFEVWAGGRAGHERLSGEIRTNTADPALAPNSVHGSRWWAGALAGFAVGVPPLWLRFELATTYHRISGELKTPANQPALDFGELDVSAWTLSPSGAIVGKF